MATQTRKRIVKNGATMKRRRGAPAQKKSSKALANFLLPLIFIVGILFCLGFLMFMGYRTATASAFFDVKKVDIRGTNRLSKDEVEKIVNRQTEKSGVWNADLTQIRDDIEKLTPVKSAVVSRILPDSLRVNVNERIPQVIVKTDTSEFWTDDEAVILGAVGKNDLRPPFVLLGWEASRNEKANKDNLERVKIYLKMLNEWQDFELAKRVSVVNLSDLHTPLAVVQDSGETVTIILAKENLGKNLKKGLEGIAGRGKEFESIDVSTNNPRLRPRVK